MSSTPCMLNYRAKTSKSDQANCETYFSCFPLLVVFLIQCRSFTSFTQGSLTKFALHPCSSSEGKVWPFVFRNAVCWLPNSMVQSVSAKLGCVPRERKGNSNHSMMYRLKLSILTSPKESAWPQIIQIYENWKNRGILVPRTKNHFVIFFPTELRHIAVWFQPHLSVNKICGWTHDVCVLMETIQLIETECLIWIHRRVRPTPSSIIENVLNFWLLARNEKNDQTETISVWVLHFWYGVKFVLWK